MSTPLLTTKLFIPPLGSFLVERARLLTQLESTLRPGCRLTLVSAPAGFGKTTLVSAWIRATQSRAGGVAAAWLALDELDNDLTRFWNYAVAALQTADRQLGKDAQILLSSGQINNPEAVLTLLINDLVRRPAPLLLVLDDFHLIDSEAVLKSLVFLLDRLPSNAHVLILTRADPHLPLALYRSRSQLLEIRLADLRFSLGEAHTFLNSAMGLNLARAPVESLHAKTEGWAAGLQMAGLALQSIDVAAAQQGHAGRTSLKPETVEEFVASFSGSNRFILDYLLEEVLRRQPVEMQAFLLKTAILERFCAPLCDTLLDSRAPDEAARPALFQAESPSQAILEKLERENLFLIPLDAQRCWYRYHQLFADLLKKRLRQTHAADEADLHARASRWFAENHDAHQAVEHAFQASNLLRAGQLLDEEGEAVLKHGEYQWLLQAIQRLPADQLKAHPNLYLYKATILASVGQLNQAETCIKDFEACLAANPGRFQLDTWLNGQIATVRALIAIFRGDASASRVYAQQALAAIPRGSDTPWRAHLLIALGHINRVDGDLESARQNLAEAIEAGKAAGDIYMTLDATTHLVMMLCAQGHLKQASEFTHHGMQYIDQFGLGNSTEASMLYLAWGFILTEQHQLEQAGETIQRGFEACRQVDIPGMLGWAYQVKLRYAMARRDWQAAEDAAREAQRLSQAVEIPAWIESGTAALRAQLWIQQGKLSAAESYLRERGILPTMDITSIEHAEYIALAILQLAQGQLDSAGRIIRLLLRRSDEKGLQRPVIMYLICLAQLEQVKGDLPAALQTLDRALGLAEPEGFRQVFLDAGEPLVPLLSVAASQGKHAAFAAEILGLPGPQFTPAPEKENESAGIQAPAAGGLPDLSQREMDVLRLIAAGLPNKEIAQRLYISLRTVKYHTTNIFTKLNVENRTQAVVQAKARGIL